MEQPSYWDFGHFKIVNPHLTYQHYLTAKHIDNPINDVDLGSQKVHQDALAAKLAPFGIVLTNVKGTLWHMPTKKGYPTKPNRHIFIVSTNHPDLFWHRHDTNKGGSSSHLIRFKKLKITLRQFLDKTDEEISVFLGL